MLDKDINKNIKTSTNDKFKFDFTFKVNNMIKKDNHNCIYCKNKNDENKILNKQNEEMKKKIIDKDKRIKELEDYINDFVNFSVKYDINNINELKAFIINKTEIINDELLYIDFDIFDDSYYEMKKQNIYYEKYLSILDNIFVNNNISSLKELDKILFNVFHIGKYDEIFNILEDADLKNQKQKLKINDLSNKYDNLNSRIKTIKNKINNHVGKIFIINGIKKRYIGKIEKPIDKIKNMEKEFDDYISHQLEWAKSIIDNDFSDNDIIKLLDIYNKLINNNESSSSESKIEFKNKYHKYLNKNQIAKNLELETYLNLGKDFIDDSVNSKKDLSSEDIKFIKEIIKTSDIKKGYNDDKINRFINTCKRYFILSQKLSDKNSLINSKCKTDIRDMNNKEFDNLLKLLDKKEN